MELECSIRMTLTLNVVSNSLLRSTVYRDKYNLHKSTTGLLLIYPSFDSAYVYGNHHHRLSCTCQVLCVHLQANKNMGIEYTSKTKLSYRL